MKRYICDGIVKGATHVRNQMPCQDNKRIVEISDKIAIIAVADGHGSSKCPRSDRGSMIAVNSFYEVMKNYLKVYGEDETGLSNLITFLNREGDMRFAQDVCEEWQARVKQSFYKNKVEGMTDEDGNIKLAHSISAGLDYPGVGPEHAYLRDSGRAQYVSITDSECMDAFMELCKEEGIIPAIESAHALAHVLKMAQGEYKGKTIVMCLSGRGDKDVHTVQKYINGEETNK